MSVSYTHLAEAAGRFRCLVVCEFWYGGQVGRCASEVVDVEFFGELIAIIDGSLVGLRVFIGINHVGTLRESILYGFGGVYPCLLYTSD